MILTEWSIDVPKEILDDLFRFAKEKLKPFYESHGCRKYALFVPIEKRYFSLSSWGEEDKDDRTNVF